jgi:hypothetical protein
LKYAPQEKGEGPTKLPGTPERKQHNTTLPKEVSQQKCSEQNRACIAVYHVEENMRNCLTLEGLENLI